VPFEGFKNEVVAKIFRPTKDESNQFRLLYRKEIWDLYRSPSITRIVKSRKLAMDKTRKAGNAYSI
jgi:hypothetical protein